MSRHVHKWELIETWDSKAACDPLPKGRWVSRGGLRGGVTYIPGFDRQMLLDRIVETIQEADRPQLTSDRWVCSCGKEKTNYHEYPSPMQLLLKGVKANE